MKERPILFNGAMVRAVLAGTKAQTRRVVKPQPTHFNPAGVPRRVVLAGGPSDQIACPYGQPGDRLWVRETFYCDNAFYPNGVGVVGMWRKVDGKRTAIPVEEQRAEMLANDMYYRADGDPEFEGAEGPTPWRPSIHMPRWASRITLEVTGVRVERLQDISEADAIAEGIAYSERFKGYCIGEAEHFNSHDPRQSYFSLWEAINGAGSVEANPYVWAVEYVRTP